MCVGVRCVCKGEVSCRILSCGGSMLNTESWAIAPSRHHKLFSCAVTSAWVGDVTMMVTFMARVRSA